MKQKSQYNIDVSTPVVVISGELHGHAVARSLGRLGVNVYGIHGRKNTVSAKSRYWKENFYWNVFTHAEEESIKYFEILSTKFKKKPILIATDDESQLFIDNNVDKLKNHYTFICQQAGLSETLLSKKCLYFLCKKNSIPTPETIFPASLKEIEDFCEIASFPVMFKGIYTETLSAKFGTRMIKVNDRDTLFSLYKKMNRTEIPNVMIQEYIPGDVIDNWMFNGYFNSDSECLLGLTGRKIRQNPVYVGMTSLGICESNKRLSDQVIKFLKDINYRGIVDIDLKYNPNNGKYYLLDINPRLGRTFRLFVDSKGTDVVRASYLDITSQNVETGNLIEGRKWVDEYLDIESFFEYRKDGILNFKDWVMTFKNIKETQWLAYDDLKPLFSISWHLFKRLIKKLLKR